MVKKSVIETQFMKTYPEKNRDHRFIGHNVNPILSLSVSLILFVYAITSFKYIRLAEELYVPPDS